MRTLRSLLAGSLVVSLAYALSAGVASGASENDPDRVLFVGNSFTFVEDVEDHVVALAASASPPKAMEADESTRGGATLKMHAQGSARSRIKDGGYDIVVLQGDIPENLEETTEPFLEAAPQLVQEARDAGSRPVIYMTWPFARRGWIGLDGIAAAHRQIEEDLGVSVAPAGLAFANALADRPDLAVILPDTEHQTIAGAYLAASTIYATLFDESPEGLPYRPAGMSADDAAFLQRTAWDAVQDWASGVIVEAPRGIAAVTTRESCYDADWADSDYRVGYDDGIWVIRDAPIICRVTSSDQRLSGASRNSWSCDCRHGIGSPMWGTWELSGPEGSWIGTYRGVRSADGTDRAFLVAEGTQAYEGSTFVANTEGSGFSMTANGVVYQGELPPIPEEPIAE